MKRIWLSPEQCTGCGLCENVCPTHGLSLEENESGFSYPMIHEPCTDCNLCEISCKKRLAASRGWDFTQSCYAAWSMDENVREKSTSGGIFYHLASEIIRRGGAVAGAGYSDGVHVKHFFAKKIEQLRPLMQSKYVQSEIGLMYQEVKKKLDKGRPVLFCGTPCQVAALRTFLSGNFYENLYTVDFICRGVNSPKAYRAWLSEIEEKNRRAISGVWFKCKEYGWKQSPRCVRFDFADGTNKTYRSSAYMAGYLNYNLFVRPSCGNCDFKGGKSGSDLTLGDFWGVESDYDDDRGTSCVMVNTEKGSQLFCAIQDKINYRETTLSKIILKNSNYRESIKISPDEENFLKELDQKTFSQAMNQYQKKHQESDNRSILYIGFKMFDKLLSIREQGKTIKPFFTDNEIGTVAIYGLGEVGVHFYQALVDADVPVLYGIDKNAADLDIAGLAVYPLTEDLPTVDAIVVTPVKFFYEIERDLLKLYPKTSVISIEQILEYIEVEKG